MSIGILCSLQGVGYGSDGLLMPIVSSQDAESQSIKSITVGEHYSTAFKGTRELAKIAVCLADCLLQGGEPETNDTGTFGNGAKLGLGRWWVWSFFDPGINALPVLTAIYPRAQHLTSAIPEFPSNCDTLIAASLAFHNTGGADITAEFDWRQEGPQTWEIPISTKTGIAILSDGGAMLSIDGTETSAWPNRGILAFVRALLT